MAKLVVTAGADIGREIPLGDFQVVGRLPSNGIPLPDDTGASRMHTRVFKNRGAFVALDLDSKNGTLVNGELVKKAELKDGDLLTVGNTSFRFALEPADLVVSAGLKLGGGSAVEIGRKKGVGEKALFVREHAPAGDSLAWLRGDLAQRPFLYKAVLWVGVALVAGALFFWTYRAAAGD